MRDNYAYLPDWLYAAYLRRSLSSILSIETENTSRRTKKKEKLLTVAIITMATTTTTTIMTAGGDDDEPLETEKGSGGRSDPVNRRCLPGRTAS